jgi:hypothetical protein
LTTPLDIITLALKDIGVLGAGQTALAEDSNDAFVKLNWMMAQWSRKRWLVYVLDTMKTLSTGATRYTIGPTGDFLLTERPDKIESAFVRHLAGLGDFDDDDFGDAFNTGASRQTESELRIIDSRELYNSIGMKRMGGTPEVLFYDTEYPLGYVYIWPRPLEDEYTIHLSYKKPLTQFATLVEDLALPPEYKMAIEYNLAARLAPGYGKALDPALVVFAKDSLETIRGANSQVPELSMPGGIPRSGRFNIYQGE